MPDDRIGFVTHETLFFGRYDGEDLEQNGEQENHIYTVTVNNMENVEEIAWSITILTFYGIFRFPTIHFI
ncbi:unnamed protein product [Caenorhabditis angaria]|uniref:Uncharacterized protein n=1 Tax=Caenorhabditis angaria TaxID=860376 RepID=A0A9P1N8U7_9PELO|nr:unnamed protein product [Caenorhabditis angaria]